MRREEVRRKPYFAKGRLSFRMGRHPHCECHPEANAEEEEKEKRK